MTDDKLDALIRELIAGFEEGAQEEARAVARRAAQTLAAELERVSTSRKEAEPQPQQGQAAEPDKLDHIIGFLQQMVEAKKETRATATQQGPGFPDVPIIPRR